MSPTKANPSRTRKSLAKFDPGRREFAKWALAGTLGTTAFGGRAMAGAPTMHDLPPGIKIALQTGEDPSDQDLQFANQLGVEYVSIWVRSNLATYDNFMRLRSKVEGAGLKVWNIGNIDLHNMGEIGLNLPGATRSWKHTRPICARWARRGFITPRSGMSRTASGVRRRK